MYQPEKLLQPRFAQVDDIALFTREREPEYTLIDHLE